MSIGFIKAGTAVLEFPTSGTNTVITISNLRDPIWDPPTSGSAQDDEFTEDVLVSGKYLIFPDSSPFISGSQFSRAGEIDASVALAGSTYRSTCVGSTLYVQVPNGQGCVMMKRINEGFRSQQLWVLGIGIPSEAGTGTGNNPRCGLALFRASGSANLPDHNNRLGVRYLTATDHIEGFNVTGGTPGTSAGGTHASGYMQFDGFMLRHNHGAAASNCQGGVFNRNYAISTAPAFTGPQITGSLDWVGWYVSPNMTNPFGGSPVFALHFFRRINWASGSIGLIAQT